MKLHSITTINVKRVSTLMGVLLVTSLNTACVSLAPEVFLVDRHTVMESEASGDWPELERVFLEDTPDKGPIALASDPESNRRRQAAFRVLNGEFPSDPALADAEPTAQ